ncbi:MAG: SDR family NAD(P)-dependent oxidoreductase [Pirellulales bacterium]
MFSRPVVLITGSAQGIGLASAVEFARRGYDTALADMQGDALAVAGEAVRAEGGAALLLQGDLADLSFAESTVRDTTAKYQRIDCLVNNAAWRELHSMKRISLDSWERTLRICLTVPAFMSRWAAEAMIPAGSGVIVNVSSIMSRHAAGTSPAYVAAKGGVDALTRELAALYGGHGIRVVAVNPGAVDTELSRDYADAGRASLTTEIRRLSEDFTPLARWARPEEIARAIAMLASDDASFITGTCVTIDGGWTANLHPTSLKRRMSPDDFPG